MMKDETPGLAPLPLGVGSWGGGCAGPWGMEVCEALLDFLGRRGCRSKSRIQKPSFTSQGMLLKEKMI